MKILLFICQAYVLFVACAGYVFGQMWAGHFNIADTTVAISGILASSLSIKINDAHFIRRYVTIFSCACGLIGVVIGAYIYYTQYDIPGNDYAWFLRGPFCLGLLFIAFIAIKKRQPDT